MRTARLPIVPVLSPGSRGGGGVVTWSWGEVEVLSPGPGGGGEGGVVTWAGGEVLSPGPGGRGGRCCDLVAHLPPLGVEVTHACENITFARFATRAVII